MSRKPPAPPARADPSARFALPIGIIAFAATLAIYAVTLYPSVPGGDSGELIVAAYDLGVAHPPGYPLFTLLGQAATWLPAGSVAWRVNLLTAILAAAAAAVLMRATWVLTRSLAAGLLAGGLFGFSPLVWRYAVGAEVFSLNNLFVALLLWLLAVFERKPCERRLFVFCVILGLGLTNHQTLLFVGAPIGLWMLLRAPGPVFWPRRLGLSAACGVAGLMPYLYLFVSPSRNPLATWGDTSTLSGFFDHVLRRQYGTFRLGASGRSSDLFDNLAAWASTLPGEMLFAGVLLPLGAIGLLVAGKAGDGRAAVKGALLALGVYLVAFNLMANLPIDDPLYREIQSRFWMQSNAIVFLLAGVGFAGLLRLRPGLPPVVGIVAALGLVGVQAGVHYQAQDQSGNRLISGIAARTLEAAPQGALMISRGDLAWNSLRYHLVCEGLRSDLRLLDIELLKAPWMNTLVRDRFAEVEFPGPMYRSPRKQKEGSYDLGGLIGANISRFEVLSNALGHDGDASWNVRFSAWPLGAWDRLQPKDAPIDVGRYVDAVERWSTVASIDAPPAIERGSWEEVAWKEQIDAATRPGTHLLNHVVTFGLDRSYLQAAGRILERAVDAGYDVPPAVQLNLGIYYFLEREHDPAAMDKMVRAFRRYLERVPPNGPQTALVRRILQDPENATVKIGAYN